MNRWKRLRGLIPLILNSPRGVVSSLTFFSQGGAIAANGDIVVFLQPGLSPHDRQGQLGGIHQQPDLLRIRHGAARGNKGGLNQKKAEQEDNGGKQNARGGAKYPVVCTYSWSLAIPRVYRI